MKLFDKKQNVILVKINTFWTNPKIETYDATIVKSNWIRNWTYTITYPNKEWTVLITEENCRFLFTNKKEADAFIKTELESWLQNAENSVNRYTSDLESSIKRYDAINELLKQY